MKSWDVIIAGAGIIGVSLALELRERGRAVLVLDRAEPGGEASSAAAGMLAAADPETPPALRSIAFESARMFPEFVRKVETAGKMQVDFRCVGTIALLPDAPAPPEYHSLSTDELHRLEPSLKSSGQSAFFVQEDSVDPSLLMRAALAATHNLGVEIRGHAEVKNIRTRAGAIEVLAGADTFSASFAVDCRGAWSGAPVKPRKGQMLYVQPQAAMLQHVLRAPDVYLVPRSSGKVLVGATVEDVGYDKSVDHATIHSLLIAATKYLPELASAPVTQSWAGLRPGTPDGLPILGATEMPGVFIASGHFRNGILLAPVTAKIMADLVEGRPSPFDIGAFAPSRFRSSLK
ncbi:MAG TPA: glycine oxidase ThiO [Candidatus Angelobacter sp.]|nr:glycine oxidase ThiO [Candidatus Angelobacter sp.]